MKSKLLVIGTVAYDAIETPFGKTDKILGGAATYIGLSASLFNIDIGIVSVVGDDFLESDLHLLQSKGIDTSGIQLVKGGKTFFWKGRYHNDLNNRETLETQLNVLEAFSPVVPDRFKDAEVLLLGNLHPKVQLDVIRQMTTRPKVIVLDTMDFWMNTAASDLAEAVKNVDVVSINDAEARQLTQEYSLVKAAKKIFKMGPKNVIIKKGEHGALFFRDNKVFFAPALPLEEVFDPTGAGDSFAGGFAGYLAKTRDNSFNNMKSAVIHGCNVASFCVEKFGTQRLQELDIETLNYRIQQFIDLTEVEIELV